MAQRLPPGTRLPDFNNNNSRPQPDPPSVRWPPTRPPDPPPSNVVRNILIGVGIIVVVILIIVFTYKPTPPVPQNIRAGIPETDNVTIYWDSVGTGISYNLYYSRQNDPATAKVLGDPEEKTSAKVTKMVSGTDYFFWVSSLQNGKESAKSSVVSVRTLLPPTVSGVTVSTSNATVTRGQTRQFSATVNGTNNPPQSVTWTVTGGVYGTSISSSGLLSIGSNETTSRLIVRATSTLDTTKYGTATVTVSVPTASGSTNQPPPISGTTWTRNDNEGRQYTMSFTRGDIVTILVRNRNGSAERDEGKYTLQGDTLTLNFGGYTESYTYSSQRIINRSNQAIVYTK